MRTFAREERTLSDPEDNGIEGNSIKEHPDMPAGHRMIFFPHRGQAWHPNFDSTENDLITTTNALYDNTASQVDGDEDGADVIR
jgi:hypothetical protein